VDIDEEDRWYAVRSVFAAAGEAEDSYEERITLWRAGSLDDAMARAATEAAEYADFAGATHLAGFAQAYQLPDGPPRDGTEVFSLIRESPLPPTGYLERFFETGTERSS